MGWRANDGIPETFYAVLLPLVEINRSGVISPENNGFHSADEFTVRCRR